MARVDVQIQPLIAAALSEDLGQAGDLTTDALISAGQSGSAVVLAKSDGVFCGGNIFVQVCRAVDPTLVVQPLLGDGDIFSAGQHVIELSGAVGGILKAERTALNFLGHLSGISSLTCQYVKRIKHTSAVILDTRKTTPGLRSIEKYAVYCGGGQSHRRGLWDMILVKENHLAVWKHPLSQLLTTIRAKHPQALIEVEVRSFDQLEQLLPERPFRVLLDHFSLEDLSRAVVAAKTFGVPLEASGNIRLETVAAVAEAGVDFISVGALTHSAPASDFSLQVQPVAG